MCGGCRTEKHLAEFNVNRAKPDGLQSQCKECKAKYFVDNRTRLLPKIKAANKAARQVISAYVVQYKSDHPCEKCGEADPCAIDFHHPDGSIKEFSVASATRLSVTLKMVKEEISKCRVLCANCHRKLHAGRFALEARKG